MRPCCARRSGWRDNGRRKPPGGVGRGCAMAIAVRVGRPRVGVGSIVHGTGVTPVCVIGVLAASSTRAAFSPHAEAIEAHNTRAIQPVLRMWGPSSLYRAEWTTQPETARAGDRAQRWRTGQERARRQQSASTSRTASTLKAAKKKIHRHTARLSARRRTQRRASRRTRLRLARSQIHPAAQNTSGFGRRPVATPHQRGSAGI